MRTKSEHAQATTHDGAPGSLHTRLLQRTPSRKLLRNDVILYKQGTNGKTAITGRLQRRITTFRVEYGLAIGSAVFLIGIVAALYAFRIWRQAGYGDLDPFVMMRLIIPSALAMTLGFQMGASSLFLSLLKLYWRQSIVLIEDFKETAPQPEADPTA